LGNILRQYLHSFGLGFKVDLFPSGLELLLVLFLEVLDLLLVLVLGLDIQALPPGRLFLPVEVLFVENFFIFEQPFPCLLGQHSTVLLHVQVLLVEVVQIPDKRVVYLLLFLDHGLHLLELLLRHPVDSKVSECLVCLVLEP
jgi:hypothetical protein